MLRRFWVNQINLELTVMLLPLYMKVLFRLSRLQESYSKIVHRENRQREINNLKHFLLTMSWAMREVALGDLKNRMMLPWVAVPGETSETDPKRQRNSSKIHLKHRLPSFLKASATLLTLKINISLPLSSEVMSLEIVIFLNIQDMNTLEMSLQLRRVM